jgi:hypothetical protein
MWGGGRVAGCGISANEYSCEHGAQINFGDPTPYLTCDLQYYCRRLFYRMFLGVVHRTSKNNLHVFLSSELANTAIMATYCTFPSIWQVVALLNKLQARGIVAAETIPKSNKHAF